MGITVTPLSDALGAEIGGVDLSRDLDGETVAAIEAAWHAHIVLLFRDQDLTPDDQIRFTGYFGPVSERGLPPARTPEGERADRTISVVTNKRENGKPIGILNDGEMWLHHDGCFQETAYKGTALYAVEVPSRGGNTQFVNMYTAYDRLAPATRERIRGLRALQAYDYGMMTGTLDAGADLSAVRHHRPPVAITHPVTGRKALYVNPLMTVRIEGLPPEDGAALLGELLGFTRDRDLFFEHAWRRGDLVLFDNWCSCHARTDFPADEIRMLRRSMVAGQRLEE